MQRDRQHGADLLAGAQDLGHDAGGRQRDAALRQRHALAVGDDLHRVLHIVEIVERLAHAHQHDIGDVASARRGIGLASASGGQSSSRSRADHHLGHDFARRSGCAPASACRCGRSVQVSVQPTWRGDAERAAVFFRDIDRSRLRGARRAASAASRNSHLRVPSARHLLGDDLRAADGEMLVQRCAQVLGDVAHRAKSRTPR